MGSIGVGPLRLISETRAGLRNVNCVTFLTGVGKLTRGTGAGSRRRATPGWSR